MRACMLQRAPADKQRSCLCVLCALPGGKVAEAWSPAVSHVVCHTNENREARRTLKFMQASPAVLCDCLMLCAAAVDRL